jgi:hypothetical protein
MTFGILHEHQDLRTSLVHTVCCLQPRVFYRIGPMLALTDSLRTRLRTSGSKQSMIRQPRLLPCFPFRMHTIDFAIACRIA